MASNSYQAVIAGRVREDEGIAFFGDNKIATPARVSQITSLGNRKQPTIVIDYLNHTGVGKPGTTTDNKSAYTGDTLIVQ
jgi:hypothetical protein